MKMKTNVKSGTDSGCGCNGSLVNVSDNNVFIGVNTGKNIQYT